jgi:SAM-dependent methyltransferase
VREDYRTSRLAQLRRVVDPATSEGLEIGAFDFPTVAPGTHAGPGRCWFADVRSSQHLSQMFGVPLETVAPIEWIVRRDRPLAEQIGRRFDYVILCHVLEHVPDPIRFLPDVSALLRPGGVLFLAVPDKRETLDAPRPSTTIDHLLARYHHGAPGPPLAQIMEFARTWDENWRRLATESPQEFFAWGVSQFESGTADVHCNVWRDEELFAQLGYLTRGGFLPELEVCLREPQANQLNEFYVALRKTPRAPS